MTTPKDSKSHADVINERFDAGDADAALYRVKEQAQHGLSQQRDAGRLRRQTSRAI